MRFVDKTNNLREFFGVIPKREADKALRLIGEGRRDGLAKRKYLVRW